MTKRARPLMQNLVDAQAQQSEIPADVSPRANVTALRPAPEPEAKAPRRKPSARTAYSASLYLPEEAAFALREIALMKRYRKPHTVMLEAMAEMFERYNKSELAAELRARIAEDEPRRA